ncbi:MAG: UDP-N-acetylmuramate dehydrogenase [Gammaproteobacteria bacterium]
MIRQTVNNQLRGVLKYHEPMSRHTSWRVGGPADIFYIPADQDDLSAFLAQQAGGETYTWLGLGSNMLVRDGGIRGTVIAISGVLDDITLIGDRSLKIGAGARCAKVARFAANSGLTGAEFLAGVPGTFGGALAMNAGAFSGETWDLVVCAETINHSGETLVRSRDKFEIGYRTVGLSEEEWFISAQIELQSDHNKSANRRIRDLLAQRARTQPMGERSCGSVFRNPKNDHAARLIDECGLKGARIGNARVSDKHANFIINDGSATAADIENLILHVQQVVIDKFGIKLEAEVDIVGVDVSE